MKKVFLAVVAMVGMLTSCGTQTDAVQSEVHGDYTRYVNPLMGTQSSFELSTGNTYPAIAMPLTYQLLDKVFQFLCLSMEAKPQKRRLSYLYFLLNRLLSCLFCLN